MRVLRLEQRDHSLFMANVHTVCTISSQFTGVKGGGAECGEVFTARQGTARPAAGCPLWTGA